MLECGVVEKRQVVVVELGNGVLASNVVRNTKVISKGINDYDNSFLEGGRMPASARNMRGW